MAGERWVFTSEQLENTPSRKSGIETDKEISYRQQAANFVQDMGQRLQVTQLCINTAIVYLHRFYMFHPFTKFHRNNMAEACLFLAAKVEEQPRKLEHVIKVANAILRRDQGPLDTKSEAYLEHAQELVVNENILLQSLGFELQVDHPHKHIVETCNLIRDSITNVAISPPTIFAVAAPSGYPPPTRVVMATAPKDLAQTSYFLATNSLHLTQMCLQNKPTFVACVCIHLACKWAQFEIPRSNEGKEWFSYVDKNMTTEILEGMTQNFLAILDKCPSKFKRKLMSKTGKEEDLLGLLSSAGPPQKKPKSEPNSAATSTVTKPPVANHDAKAEARSSKPESSSSQPKPETSRTKPEVSLTSPPGKPDSKVSKPSGSDSGMRRVKTESSVLTIKEYAERREKEIKEQAERKRIEQERQQIMAEKEKAAALKDRPRPSSSKPHTNIFEEMSSKLDTGTDLMEKPKDKHSLERSQHNYKEKYHEKDPATSSQQQQPRKLPFSVDVSKLPKQHKPQKPRDHRSESGRVHKSDHRSSDQRGRDYPDSRPPGRDGSLERKDPTRHDRMKLSETPGKPPLDRLNPGRPIPGDRLNERPVSERPSERPRSTERPKERPIPSDKPSPVKKPSPAEKPKPRPSPAEPVSVPYVDPEEGEILDDDSPEDARKSQSHRHHHRERRSSGHRHQSPGAAPAADTQRRHSPRSRKEESKPELTNSIRLPTKPDATPALSRLTEDGVERATPEPGEIVESQGHRHHKSKSHKRDKHNRSADPELNASSGSLKLKFDLKGRVPTPTSMSSPSEEDRRKEQKKKIKSAPEPDGAKDQSSSSLKFKYKLSSSSSSSSTVTAGNGESSSSKPLKLVLSKDSQGQYTPSSNKPHKHSDKSRKRPFSPSEPAGPQRSSKLPRNDSSSHLDLVGEYSASGSPAAALTPSKQDLKEQLDLVQQIVKAKQDQILAAQKGGKKPRNQTPPSSDDSVLPH